MSSSSWIICRNSTGRERSEGSLVSVVMFSFLTASTLESCKYDRNNSFDVVR